MEVYNFNLIHYADITFADGKFKKKTEDTFRKKKEANKKVSLTSIWK